MSQQYEYAVIDGNGQLMGMPARTYDTESAANGVRQMLVDRIDAMAQSATKAREWLADGELDANGRAQAREMVEAYEANKDATYRVMRRLVGTWEPA